MGQTITIRLTKEQAIWLEETAARIGVSQGHLIRTHIENARQGTDEKPFMRLAGAIDGPADLSRRKGFSKKAS
jgi:hypothetical protein